QEPGSREARAQETDRRGPARAIAAAQAEASADPARHPAFAYRHSPGRVSIVAADVQAEPNPRAATAAPALDQDPAERSPQAERGRARRGRGPDRRLRRHARR